VVARLICEACDEPASGGLRGWRNEIESEQVAPAALLKARAEVAQ